MSAVALLAAAKVETNDNGSVLICDGWLHLRFAKPARQLLADAWSIRRDLQHALRRALEAFQVELPEPDAEAPEELAEAVAAAPGIEVARGKS